MSAIVERDDDGACKRSTSVDTTPNSIAPGPPVSNVRQRSPKGNLYSAARGVRSETARRHLFQRQKRIDDVDNDVELGPCAPITINVNDEIQTLDE